MKFSGSPQFVSLVAKFRREIWISVIIEAPCSVTHFVATPPSPAPVIAPAIAMATASAHTSPSPSDLLSK